MINQQSVPSEVLYYSFEEALEQTRALVETTLLKAPRVIRDYTSHLARSQGKYIRARGLLVSALNREGKIHENAVIMGASIELLHLATLVHDDVIDDSDLRRGQETLQKRFGKKKAVICGDYLLSFSLRLTSRIKNREEYTEYDLPSFVSRVCLGEMDQYANNGNLSLSTLRYLKIIRGKTAALFEGAFLAGGIFSGDGKDQEHQYGKLGRYIGMIFQLSDDCIDFEASREEAMKPVGRDMEAGVVTLPVIHAMKESPDLKSSLESNQLTTEDLIRLVFQYDGIGYTRKISGSYYKKASEIIRNLSVDEDKRRELRLILDKAYNGIKK